MNGILKSITAPSGWRFQRFGTVVTRRRETGQPGLDPLSVFLDQGVVPRASRDDNYNALGEDLSKYLVVRPNDLVFNKLRAWQGGFGVSRHEGLVSPAYFVCEPSHRVEPRYLHYLLHSTPWLQELTRVSKWMPPSQFDIGWEDLRELPVLLPTRETQRDIADFLDAETARIDALIDKKRSLIARLHERFDGEIFIAVTRGLDDDLELQPVRIPWIGQIPVHWGLPAVGANYDVQLGKMLNPAATEGPTRFPYLRNVNIQWDRVILDDLLEMNFDEDEQRRLELRPGDLLVCEGGDVGRAALWRGELDACFFQKAIHRVRSRREGNTRFLMYCLRAAAKQGVFAVEGNQSTIVHLTAEQLRVHRFPWPPLSEQDEIVARLDTSKSRRDALARRLERQIVLLREHRQALITSAVTGQLDLANAAS